MACCISILQDVSNMLFLFLSLYLIFTPTFIIEPKESIEKEHRILQNCSCSDNKGGVTPMLVFDDIKVEFESQGFQSTHLCMSPKKDKTVLFWKSTQSTETVHCRV